MQPQAMMRGIPGVPHMPQLIMPHGGMFAIPVMMQPAAAPLKRPLDSGDEELVAPKKKSRGKAKANEGTYLLFCRAGLRLMGDCR